MQVTPKKSEIISCSIKTTLHIADSLPQMADIMNLDATNDIVDQLILDAEALPDQPNSIAALFMPTFNEQVKNYSSYALQMEKHQISLSKLQKHKADGKFPDSFQKLKPLLATYQPPNSTLQDTFNTIHKEALQKYFAALTKDYEDKISGASVMLGKKGQCAKALTNTLKGTLYSDQNFNSLTLSLKASSTRRSLRILTPLTMINTPQK